MISFESPDLERLVSDLRSAQTQILPAAKAVISKGALNIRRAAQAAAPNPHNAGLYVNSITYTLTESGSTVEAEIGPDKDKPQGALGNLLEFGGSKGGAKPHLVPAFEDESPPVEDYLGRAAERLLGG